MSIDQCMAAFRSSPVIVCIRQSDTDRARAAAHAVLDGGLRLIEFTLTTPGALELIAEFAADDRAIVGAGTVLDVADVERVAAANGRFLLSPVFDAEVVEAASALGLLAVPGTATPTEMLRAHRGGARLVKVFPIGQLGGANYLRAVRGPLPQIPLAATNGVTLETVVDYFEAGVTAVGIGGAALFPVDLASDDLSPVVERARAFVDAVAPYTS